MNFAAMVGESPEGFRMTVLPQTMEASVMPPMMAAGKFHGEITAPTPSGMYQRWSCSPGNCTGRCRLGEADRFQRVHHAEVNQFGDIAVGLGIVLADFEDQPRHQLELALAHELRGPEQQVGARLPRGAAPALECLERGFHGGRDFGRSGFLVNADDLRGMRRVDRFVLLGGLHAAAADDQVVLASQFVADLLDRGAHAPLVLRIRPVDRAVR